MEPINTEEYKGYQIEILPDEINETPRDWSNLGVMVCFHRRYNLGDKHSFRDPEEFDLFIRKEKAIQLPLYIFDHSGITMRTHPFGDRWDSGQVGWIYVLYETIQKEYGLVNETTKEKAKKVLEAEVKVYDDYLTGNVYGYRVLNAQGKELDACWGFYGNPEGEGGALVSAKEFVDQAIEKKRKKNKPAVVLVPVPAF